MDVRHVEIVDWLIRESGSVRIKAQLELGGNNPLVILDNPLRPNFRPRWNSQYVTGPKCAE